MITCEAMKTEYLLNTCFWHSAKLRKLLSSWTDKASSFLEEGQGMKKWLALSQTKVSKLSQVFSTDSITGYYA